MKIVTLLSRIIVGLVFTFSGFVKGVDPMGSAYKFSDYFSAFGLQFLDPLAMPLSIILCTIEFVTGMMILSGSFMKISSWIVTLFMMFFTPLTLILALFNPVSDCGCFGDAIHLTNWQTFIKNIIISVFVFIVFIRKNDKTATLKKSNGTIMTSVYVLVFISFVIINLLYLPVIDFRPYKTGTDIQSAMAIPADAPADKYDIRFVYEKEGVEKEFTLSDYPANDTTWKFVDQKSVLISKGYVPPIHDFSLITSDGTDKTEDITSSTGYSLLMISKKTEEASLKDIIKGVKAGDMAIQNDVRFYIITSSSNETAEPLAQGHTLLFGDETTLKTIVRANPGFLLIKDGTVVAKWASTILPDPGAFADPEKLSQIAGNNDHLRGIITFSLFSLLLLISIFIPYYKKY